MTKKTKAWKFFQDLDDSGSSILVGSRQDAIGRYRCLSCEHEYSHPHAQTRCPICPQDGEAGKYVKWLNYKEPT